jgi:hypothetical protein
MIFKSQTNHGMSGNMPNFFHKLLVRQTRIPALSDIHDDNLESFFEIHNLDKPPYHTHRKHCSNNSAD